MLKIRGFEHGIVFVVLYLLSILALRCDATGRKFTQVKTDCSTNTTIHNVVYVKAEGDSDTIHHVWSSVGSFAIFNALTSNTSEMTINCERLLNNLPNAIMFSEEPFQSLVVLLTKLYEFNDPDDTATLPSNLSDPTVVKEYSFQNLTWNNVTVSESGNSEIEVIFNLSHHENDTIGADAVQLHLSAFGTQERFAMLPRLIHTPNSVQLDVMVDHARLNFKSSRFAIEVMLLGLREDGHLIENSYKSIDDEYTPGVFRIKQVQSQSLRSNQSGPYMQWKPTAYTKYPHVHESSTMAVEYSLSDPMHFEEENATIIDGIAFAYYGSRLGEIFGQSIKISFGMVEDEFYQKTNYLSWTFAVGYGKPPKDEMSSFIIIVISVGLGIPAILLLGGSIFNVVRKRTKKDELLLSSEQ